MPKILRIINRLNIGGPTYNVAYLSKFINQTYETNVLAGIREPYEGSSEYVLKDLGVGYEFVPDMHRQINFRNDISAYRAISEKIRQYKPDIVHTHAAKAGALGRLAAYRSSQRPKILHTYHGNVFDGYFSPLKTKVFLGVERYLCSVSDAIIAISEMQKKDLAEKYKIAPADKIHVIKLGFDLEKFRFNREDKRKQFREFYGIDEQTVVISITGRLTSVKNHLLLIQSIKNLKDNYPHLKVKFFFVGDGELMADIVTSLKEQGISICLPGDDNYKATVILTSWRKDIDVINAGSDIIALTSLNEGTPVSIIEALASGRSVICTNVGGIGDVVQDNVNGILSSLDAKEFTEKLYNLITSKTLRERLAHKGEEAIFQNYSYKRLVNDMEMLYASLL